MEILNGVHSAGQKPCGTWRNSEDWFSFDCRHIGVYDGATPAGKSLYMGRDGFTDASWVSQTTASIVKDNIRSFNAASESFEPIGRIYTRLRSIFKNATGLEVKTLKAFQRPATTMSCVFDNGNYLRFVQVGDSPIGIVLRNGDVRVMQGDPVLLQNDKNITAELKKLRQKYPDIPHADIMARRELPRIRHLMNAANDGYGVMTPQNPETIYAQQQNFHKNDVTGFIVLTDGLAEAYDTFDMFDSVENFVKFVIEHPQKLNDIHRELRKRQNADPQCKTIPRIKMGDDIAAIIGRPLRR